MNAPIDYQKMILETVAELAGSPMTPSFLCRKLGKRSGPVHKALGYAVKRGAVHLEWCEGMKFFFLTSVDAAAYGQAALRRDAAAVNAAKAKAGRDASARMKVPKPKRARQVPESEKPKFSTAEADYSRAKFTRAEAPKPRFDTSGAAPLFRSLGIGRYVEAA